MRPTEKRATPLDDACSLHALHSTGCCCCCWSLPWLEDEVVVVATRAAGEPTVLRVMLFRGGREGLRVAGAGGFERGGGGGGDECCCRWLTSPPAPTSADDGVEAPPTASARALPLPPRLEEGSSSPTPMLLLSLSVWAPLVCLLMRRSAKSALTMSCALAPARADTSATTATLMAPAMAVGPAMVLAEGPAETLGALRAMQESFVFLFFAFWFFKCAHAKN